MRIYSDPVSAAREVERDLWEMGLDIHPQTMQDKDVSNDLGYVTKELSPYCFQITDWQFNMAELNRMVSYVLTGKIGEAHHETEFDRIFAYIHQEHIDRTDGGIHNPGRSYMARRKVWDEFLHGDPPKFAYTYSERIQPQLNRIITELDIRPETRQAIINVHSNICATLTMEDGHHVVRRSADIMNMGGSGRIPCSMYYQFLRRRGVLDMVYTMRSCDFLTHFPVDFALALRMRNHIAGRLGIGEGRFTYFAGSLHAYSKDMKARGIF